MKSRIERVLGSGAVGRLTRWRVRGKVLILAYHGVIPRDEPRLGAGERALFIHQDRFAEHLDALVELADVVSLDQIDTPGDGRPRVAITFDDAYEGAVTRGVAELVSRHLPATIFVSPSRLDGHVFWWDALAHTTAALDPDVRSYALVTLGGSDERVRAWAAERNIVTTENLPGYARAASREALDEAVAKPGITVGSHTWSHANLAVLDERELAAELEQPLSWLRERFGARVIPWLAYPYGLDSQAVRRAAAATGYAASLRISGGWHRAADVSPFARPRLNIPAGLSVNGLRARLIGSIVT